MPPHHTRRGFRNPHDHDKHGLLTYLRMRLTTPERMPHPDRQQGRVPLAEPDLERIHHPGDAPQATWIGHSTVLVQYRGVNLLTDPVFRRRASPLSFAGPRRYTRPAPDLAALPDIHYVALSHNHYDHLDRDTVRRLGDGPRWLVPLGLRRWFLRAGVSGDRVRAFDWWDSHDFGDLRATATPTQHFSSRTPWDRDRTLWLSWALRIHDFSVWFGGDTGYNPHQFREIGQRLGGFDLGLIPIGAYDPRWFMKAMHICPEEAVRIHREVRARRSIAIHWGTFPMTSEPVDEPPRRLEAALRDQGVPLEAFQVLSVGETRAFPI